MNRLDRRARGKLVAHERAIPAHNHQRRHNPPPLHRAARGDDEILQDCQQRSIQRRGRSAFYGAKLGRKLMAQDDGQVADAGDGLVGSVLVLGIERAEVARDRNRIDAVLDLVHLGQDAGQVQLGLLAAVKVVAPAEVEEMRCRKPALHAEIRDQFRIIANQKKRDAFPFALGDSVRRQGRGDGDHLDGCGIIDVNAVDDPFDADREVALGGEALVRGQHPPGMVCKQNCVGIGAARVDAKYKTITICSQGSPVLLLGRLVPPRCPALAKCRAPGNYTNIWTSSSSSLWRASASSQMRRSSWYILGSSSGSVSASRISTIRSCTRCW